MTVQDNEIREFVITYGITEYESTDSEMMLNTGHFWSEKYHLWFNKNNMLYDNKDEIILDIIYKEK